MTSRERALVEVLGKCQDLFGRAEGAYLNDRAADRARELVAVCREGFRVCVEALAPYPPPALDPLPPAAAIPEPREETPEVRLAQPWTCDDCGEERTAGEDSCSCGFEAAVAGEETT